MVPTLNFLLDFLLKFRQNTMVDMSWLGVELQSYLNISPTV